MPNLSPSLSLSLSLSPSLPEPVPLSTLSLSQPESIPLTITLTLPRSPSLCLDDVPTLLVIENLIESAKHPYLSKLIQELYPEDIQMEACSGFKGIECIGEQLPEWKGSLEDFHLVSELGTRYLKYSS
ncbi:hypothetical protein CFP56_038333 [Quercus suber]|uniref:Uncharacterized protein n=1 Tax=Quercus suber TaxID=58331 RepID=A0AAW0LQH7_QUESU